MPSLSRFLTAVSGGAEEDVGAVVHDNTVDLLWHALL